MWVNTNLLEAYFVFAVLSFDAKHNKTKMGYISKVALEVPDEGDIQWYAKMQE